MWFAYNCRKVTIFYFFTVMPQLFNVAVVIIIDYSTKILKIKLHYVNYSIFKSAITKRILAKSMLLAVLLSYSLLFQS